MRIDLSSNINEVLGWTARLSPQFQFAAAKALTDTAAIVRNSMPAEAELTLDRPTPYTKGGFYSQGARKDKLFSVVGIKDRQAQYLWWQVEGGTRAPARKALKLPQQIDLNEFGNIPPALIRTLIARAKMGKRATKGQAKRFGVSSKVDLFYGDPADSRPPGIYKRVGVGDQAKLVPLVLFPARSARYVKRPFDFHQHASRVTLREFGPALDRTWKLAMATAR